MKKSIRHQSKNAFTKQKSLGQILALMNALALAGTTAQAAEPTDATAAKPKDPAKPADASADDASTLDEVVVKGTQDRDYKPSRLSSSKYNQPLLDTAQTITVVPKGLIQDQNATTLRDVLRNVPGISYQAGEGGGGAAGDRLSIRGFSAVTDMSVDGIRDIGFYNRDPFNLEQVEVAKGPASAYSGRGSTGGTVNLVTKTPKMEDSYEANVGYGTDQYYRTSIDINQSLPFSEEEFSIPGMAFRLNGYFHDQEFAGRSYTENQRWGIAPSFAAGLGTDTRVILTYLHQYEDNTPSYGIPHVTSATNPYGGAGAVNKVAPVPYDTFFGLLDRDYEKTTTDVVTARTEHDFSDNVKMENISRYGRTYRDSILTAPRLVNNSGGTAPGFVGVGINHQLQSKDQTNEIFANVTNLKTEFETWEIKHNMVSSFEFNKETEVNYARSAPTLFTLGTTNLTAPVGNPFDPDPYAPSTGPITRTGAVADAATETVAFSAFDTITLTEQWILNFGLRVEHYDTQFNNLTAAGNMTSFERGEWMPTWRTGLTYKPVPYGSFYFGYGTSVNPSGEGFTTGALSGSITPLEPEESDSYEIGTKWDLFQEKLNLGLAFFRTEKTNARTTDPTNTSIVTTTGEVRVQGIEASAAGSITDEWKVFAAYTIMESEIIADANPDLVGKELSNTPEQTGSIWTTYALPFDVEIGTGAQYVDTRFNNNNNRLEVEGYWLQDFMLAYRPNPNWTIQLNISNLWDKEYIDRVGGGHSIPGVGRTFIVSTGIKF